MQSNDVIDNFIIKVNPLVFDYTKFCLLTVRINGKEAYNGSNKHRDIVYTLTLLGDVIYRVDGIGNVSVFLLAVKGEAEDRLGLLVDALGPSLVQNRNTTFPNIRREQFSSIDFKIMRCLYSNLRMEISDITQTISMSSKISLKDLKD